MRVVKSSLDLEVNFMSRSQIRMNGLSIGDVAKQAGIATSTIRYYERIGLLPPSPRANGRRRYQPDIVNTLQLIRLAQQMGCSIAEIQTLLHGFPAITPPAERWQALADKKLAELDRIIARAQAMKTLMESTRDCQCHTLDECAEGTNA
jgi:MerR family redox-sensitive transcriptional activator SoxR